MSRKTTIGSSSLIESDGKIIVIYSLQSFGDERPAVRYKLKYREKPEVIGRILKDSLDRIQNEYYEENEDNKSIFSWRKRGGLSFLRCEDGSFSISSTYVNHDIMTFDDFDKKNLASDISDAELGKAALSALAESLDYLNRKEMQIYFSENEGLLFVPFAQNSSSGYVAADHCVCVKPPYSVADIRKALDDISAYISENPEDKRNKKQRKDSLPWREFSHYKSFGGFLKNHHCIELHIKTDGSFVFIPTLRLTGFNEFVLYTVLRKNLDSSSTDDMLRDEIFSSLDVCEKIYRKSMEPDESVHHDLFFDYVEQLADERG